MTDRDMIQIERRWAMPNGNTFMIPPIKQFVEEYILNVDVRGGEEIVDPFANNCRYGTITNDLNKDYSTDFHMDALEFLKTLDDESAALVLYDPPYSPRQASELYKSVGKEKLTANVTNAKYWSECKDQIARIVKRGGYACHLDGIQTALGRTGDSILRGY